MKTIKIGASEWDLCETAEDLPIRRFVILKQYMIFRETGVDAASMAFVIQDFLNGFDNNSKSEMVITLYNYLTGLNSVQGKSDASQLIFALITLGKDEDRNNFDETKAKEKLEIMADNGLEQKFVEETIVNFIQASSARFLSYFQENLMRPEVENPKE